MKSLMLLGLLSLSALLPSQSHAKVKVNERALVVISELDSIVAPEMRTLYTALEHLTQFSVQGILSLDYVSIDYLANKDATMANFKNKIRALAAKPGIKAIDVILSLHGSKGRLYFYDRSWGVTEMEKEFLRTTSTAESELLVKVKKKLRMMYNLSCYGDSHNPSFIRMGFDTSNGSVSVNANSEVEFVPALTSWKVGMGFKPSFYSSNNAVALFYADAPVRAMGRAQNTSLKNTNSKKIFVGQSTLKISTDPI